MSRILGVLVALGIARLLPGHGAGLWFRLGAATLALLLPFAGRGAAEALAWSVGALFVSLAAFVLRRGGRTRVVIGPCEAVPRLTPSPHWSALMVKDFTTSLMSSSYSW